MCGILTTVTQCENQLWPVSPLWASTWLPSQLQWTGRRCIMGLSCGWKNDAWNTCSSHDTNQMNGVFTYSDNKFALERNSTAGVVFFIRTLITSSSLVFKPMTWNLTRRGITQSTSVYWDRFEKRKWPMLCCCIMLALLVIDILLEYIFSCKILGLLTSCNWFYF